MLVVKIEGHGVSPGDVSARKLAGLLQATHPLIEIRPGSAAFAFAAANAEDDETFANAAGAAFDYASARGEGAPPEARKALLRLHKVAGLHDALALRVDAQRTRAREPRVIAPPLDVVGVHLRMTTTLHGTVVGVEPVREGCRDAAQESP